jgi:hypothetical protein
VDVVKVAGGQDYRQVMTYKYSPQSEEPQLQETPISAPQERWHLPPWLGGKRRPATPVIPMLRTLKTATESYLEEQVTWVSIVLPFQQSGLFLEDLHASLPALSLKTPRLLRAAAGLTVWDTHCITDPKECSGDEEPSNVLSVDYTKSAFTGTIFEEECCTYVSRNLVYYPSLGFGAVAADPTAGRERLQSALNKLINTSLGSVPDGKRDEILSNVVLTGEFGDDIILGEVVKKVLREQYGSKAQSITQQKREPVFAAARAAALNCWKDLNDPFSNLLKNCDYPFSRLVNWFAPAFTNGEQSCSTLLEWLKKGPGKADL